MAQAQVAATLSTISAKGRTALWSVYFAVDFGFEGLLSVVQLHNTCKFLNRNCSQIPRCIPARRTQLELSRGNTCYLGLRATVIVGEWESARAFSYIRMPSFLMSFFFMSYLQFWSLVTQKIVMDFVGIVVDDR